MCLLFACLFVCLFGWLAGLLACLLVCLFICCCLLSLEVVDEVSAHSCFIHSALRRRFAGRDFQSEAAGRAFRVKRNLPTAEGESSVNKHSHDMYLYVSGMKVKSPLPTLNRELDLEGSHHCVI